MVNCLERGADLHIAQLMPLPLTVSCFSKIQLGFTFLVPAYLGSPGQRAIKRVCVPVLFICSGTDEENITSTRIINKPTLYGYRLTACCLSHGPQPSQARPSRLAAHWAGW